MIDRYKILEQLGEGGVGSVHKAWDKKLQRHVALKLLLPPEKRTADTAGTDLGAESAALSSLQHPNIVGVYDFDCEGPEPFVVMEYLNGENLEQTVRRGAVTIEDFLKIAHGALEGLDAAHQQGMTHRDIKPGNLMFHWLPNGTWQAKLLDFGLANFTLRPQQQQVGEGGTVAGSVYFMAPEQFLHAPIDARADLYSLGCLLYYALTASYPCTGSTMEEVMNAHISHQIIPLDTVRQDVSPLLCDWVMWLMSRQPEERPDTAGEALKVLTGIVSGELTIIPQKRALRTASMQVPGRGPAGGAVVSASLSPDGKAAPQTRPAPAPGLATRPGAITMTAQVVPAPRGKTGLYAGIAVALLAVGVGVFFLARGSGETPAPEAAVVIAEPETMPPLTDLLLWYDGEHGLRKSDGRKDAQPGDRVDLWDDRAEDGGQNPLQYYASGTQDKESRFPTVAVVDGEAGLVGRHTVLRFNGNCLVAGRDRDGVGDPVAAELSGTKLTWFVVFRTDSDDEQRILEAAVGENSDAWDSSIRKGEVYSGVRLAEGQENHSITRFERDDGFHILTVVWSGGRDELQQWLTNPFGKTVEGNLVRGTPDYGDLSQLRIGSATKSSGHSGAYPNSFHGDIASILVYRQSLTDGERRKALDYLCQRYFGRPPVE